MRSRGAPRHWLKMTDRKKPLTYAQVGVDIDAGNALVEKIKPLVRATRRPGADAEIGGFGGLFDLKAAGFKDPILVAANDGVGTKIKLAIDSGLNTTIGIDLVVQGAEPLFFLDYYATGRLDPDFATGIVAGIADGCRQAGAALIGGETAEMPGLYAGKDYDLAGFAVGAVERGHILPKEDVKPGDVVLGLASSGLHSNGFSLVRRVLEETGLKLTDPAPFGPGQSLAEALLTPTRIYVRSVLQALRQTAAIKALAHITGGGFPDNIPRVLPKTLGVMLDLAAIPMPPVFGWLKAAGHIEEREMLRTFNCGIGMIVIAEANAVPAVEKIFRDLGERPVILGKVIEATDPRVTYSGRLSL